MILATRLAAREGLLSMSSSQRRTTFQPSWPSRMSFSRSRRMFVLILLIQYFAFGPRLNLRRRVSQFLPCQKSPSQNTTSRARGNTTSGLPGSSETFFRNRSLSLHSSERSSRSHFVSEDLLATITALACGDEDTHFSKEGRRLVIGELGPTTRWRKR